MHTRLAHRGPDGEGVWLSEDGIAGLAHRRLSIIDLSGAASQPMSFDGNLVLTYNGEIYNYVELREELAGDWTFRTNSDSECILAAYAKYGRACVNRLRGIFAFAIWDSARRTLFCARDHFGVKPLHYARDGDWLAFASEAKALAGLFHPVEVDQRALAEYLVFQIPMTNRTLFRGVESLPPGSWLAVSEGKVEIKTYWRLDFHPDPALGYPVAAKEIEHRFREAIRFNLRSDVPVAAYLSGGTDSSLVALAAQQVSAPMDAFHGRFPEQAGYDESRFARLAATHGGLNLHIRDIFAADFAAALPKVIACLDQPIAGPGSVPQYLVSELAARHGKVILGGQGADEIFGGYTRFFAGALDASLSAEARGEMAPPGLARADLAPGMNQLNAYQPLLKALVPGSEPGMPFAMRYLRLIDRTADSLGAVDWSGVDRGGAIAAYQTAFEEEALHEVGDVWSAMLSFEVRKLLPALLHVEDRVSMAHGLEARVPFLDVPLAEYAASAPTRAKLHDGKLKALLYRAGQDILPSEISARTDKMGFPVPLQEWFGGSLKEMVVDTMTSRRAKTRGYLDPAGLEQLLAPGSRYSRSLWGLLSLELWHQAYVDNAPAGVSGAG
jgi:asparagine synthase (glutamine-hydrolysing)